MSPENIEKTRAMAQAILERFKSNPESQEKFIDWLDMAKKLVFGNPALFRAFLNRAYERHAENIKELQGSDRTHAIQQFSDFVTKVSLEFAEKNQLGQFSSAIKAHGMALKWAEEKISVDIWNTLKQA